MFRLSVLSVIVSLPLAFPAVAGPVSDALAKARCTQPIPGLDEWLRKDRPSEADVRAAFKRQGEPIRKDSTIKAYFAWLAADRDHEAAAEIHGKGIKGYVEDFACWK